MYRSVEAIIAESKRRETKLHAAAEEIVGSPCDSIRGFIDISTEWKLAVDAALNIEADQSGTDKSVARVASLSILTNRTLEAAGDIVRVIRAGSTKPALTGWRALTEAKNNALLIYLDESGRAGFLWTHHGIIKNGQLNSEDEMALGAARMSRQFLESAGEKYDRKDENAWAVAIDGKIHRDAVSRSRYVAKHSPFMFGATQDERDMLAEAEQRMIRESNAVVHPTLGKSFVDVPVPAILLATIIEPMSVMMSYKVAASELQGWPSAAVMGDQFVTYPEEATQAQALSVMAGAMYLHCMESCRAEFLDEGIETNP